MEKVLACFLAAVLAGRAGTAASATLDDLVAGAKKEGQLEFYGPSTLGPEGAKALGEAFNKKYGLNVTLQYNPSGNMTRDTGKVIGLSASGQPAEWDVMVVTDAHHGSLWLRKLHKTFDYTQLGVKKERIEYDGGTVSIANQFALPTYNKKLLPAKDVPKKWEDLLDPRWKGKLGVINSTHHFARLAAGAWGEEKTTEFVRKLAAQKPILSRAGEMAQRLILGEVLLSATLQDSQLHEAEQSGAPLAFATEVQPVVSPEYHVGVLKHAPHPNVATLFVAFMASPEVQTLWKKYTGHTSAYVPGTDAYKFAQGKKVVYMKQDQAKLVDKLAREYGKILGFNR
ncbi:MAG TPA: extracellular solute-binding protein [candidate division Zixibacteria bacterium]|nr:extracellular solute-binding protein [candidate division Zixibacteria bacterium]